MNDQTARLLALANHCAQEPAAPSSGGHMPLRDAIKADPEVAALLAGDPLQAAIIGDLIDAYADEVNAQHDALLGDIDNWRPIGILAALERDQP